LDNQPLWQSAPPLFWPSFQGSGEQLADYKEGAGNYQPVEQGQQIVKTIFRGLFFGFSASDKRQE
jgi:hypothetical protein